MSEFVQDEILPETTEVVNEEECSLPEESSIPSAESVLSQKDYSPTPYVATIWEIVGEQVKERDFVSMSLEVMRDSRASADPMFDSFCDGEAEFSNGGLWETPGGKHVTTVDQDEDETPQIDQAVVDAQLAEKYEEGHAAGLQEGRAEAEEKIVESYEALGKRMNEITEGIEENLREHVNEMERQVLRFALQISKKIVETTAQVKPEYIHEIIRTGLKNLGASKPIQVRVSAQDYEFLEIVGLPNDLTPGELGITYASDETIKSGCIIETDFGEVNLELDKMWEEIKDKLYPVCE